MSFSDDGLPNLSEEAEEDMANNNDPNNNAAAGDSPPMQDANLVAAAAAAAAPAPAAAAAAAAAAVAAPVAAEPSSSGTAAQASLEGGALEEANEFVLEQMRELARGEEERREELRKELEDNANLILKLMPRKNFDEVYHYLEAHYDKPHRVQVRLLVSWPWRGGRGRTAFPSLIVSI